MAFKTIFLNFFVVCLVLFGLMGCNGEKSKKNKEDNKTLENNATSLLKSKQQEEDSLESPLQQQLKKNLKSHLDELSKELQEKNLNNLQMEQKIGLQKHLEHFESYHGRKDIPKKDSAQRNLNEKIQEAYEIQQKRIEALRQKNDEMSK